MKHIPGHCRWR